MLVKYTLLIYAHDKAIYVKSIHLTPEMKLAVSYICFSRSLKEILLQLQMRNVLNEIYLKETNTTILKKSFQKVIGVHKINFILSLFLCKSSSEICMLI